VTQVALRNREHSHWDPEGKGENAGRFLLPPGLFGGGAQVWALLAQACDSRDGPAGARGPVSVAKGKMDDNGRIWFSGGHAALAPEECGEGCAINVSGVCFDVVESVQAVEPIFTWWAGEGSSDVQGTRVRAHEIE
jgi:hypothetical protein